MGLQNAVDDRRVFHLRRAFVVNDDVEALGPIAALVDRIQMGVGGVGIVGDGDFDASTRGEPLERMSCWVL